MSDGSDRLFVYGSLQPGGSNEHVLAKYKGEWLAAYVRGHLINIGWGANEGYPGLIPDGQGDTVHGFVFASASLPGLWAELDAFEGADYARACPFKPPWQAENRRARWFTH